MNLLNELAVGKTIEFEDGTQRTITEKSPHQDIKNAYYYKFDDGYIERDVRIHGKIISNLVEPLSYASPASSGVQNGGRFRKKPVVIEAMQYNAYSTEVMDKIERFVGGDIGKDAEGNTVIATLEGTMKVSHLDWVIKGVKGEFYPCKPDIFEATYEKL